MTTYTGWTESDEHRAARVARRNAEHERIIAAKEAEQIKVELPTSATVSREG